MRLKKILGAHGARSNSVTGDQAEITRYVRPEGDLCLLVHVLESSSCYMRRDLPCSSGHVPDSVHRPYARSIICIIMAD